jgi:hypothetical protein
VNPKQKNIALLLGFVILFWIAYQLSFSNTFALKKQYAALKKEQELFSNISHKLIQLKQQNQYYDSILKSKKIATENSFQNNLLQTISSFADTTNIKIVSFQNPHLFKTDNAIINTYSFTVNGDFSKITQLIYSLEQQFKLGKIIFVHFVKKKNYRRNNYYLECTILLQRIESS